MLHTILSVSLINGECSPLVSGSVDGAPIGSRPTSLGSTCHNKPIYEHYCYCCSPGSSRNYRLNRNKNSAIFFSYVCNGKKITEWLASTLNGIATSVL